MSHRRLPRKIDFGLEVVTVRQVTAREMRDITDCDNDDPAPEGAWDHDEETIYILRSLPLGRKREVLFHELVHAAIDMRDWARQKMKGA